MCKALKSRLMQSLTGYVKMDARRIGEAGNLAGREPRGF